MRLAELKAPKRPLSGWDALAYDKISSSPTTGRLVESLGSRLREKSSGPTTIKVVGIKVGLAVLKPIHPLEVPQACCGKQLQFCTCEHAEDCAKRQVLGGCRGRCTCGVDANEE